VIAVVITAFLCIVLAAYVLGFQDGRKEGHREAEAGDRLFAESHHEPPLHPAQW